MEILSDPTPDMLAMPRFDDGAIDMQELLRRLAEQVVNAVMDAEADQLCGGGGNSRNGYRERSLATCVGTLTLRIPKLRSGSFFPEDVLERYQRVASTAVVTAIGCDAGGWRRVLGVDVVDTESYDSWLAFLRAIRSRGAAGVRLVVSDAHPGLVRALGEVFQGAAWQRCAVHLMRDCMREAGSWQLRRRVGRIVSQVFRGRDAATVTAMYHAACDMLEGCCPRAAAVLEEAEPDALAYLDFPPTHWKRLRTNNVQERTNREIKRRSRVVQVFPSTGSLVRLAGAVMCEQDEIWQESRYFSEVRMNELYDDGRTRGIDGPVDWARLEAEARKMLESGLELADRVEAA